MMNQPLKDRFLSYEVAPHPSAWETISDELLQHNDLTGISRKMFSYEAQPPIDTWKKIKESLLADQETPAPPSVIPKIFPVSKLVVAACVTGLLVIGAFYVSNFTKDKFKAGKLSEPTAKNKDAARPINSSRTGSISVKEPERDEVAMITVENSPKTKASAKERDMELQTTQVGHSLPTSAYEPEIIITTKPIRNLNGEIIQDTDILDNGNQYISITSPNGQQTKISSKFLHMLLFINDDSDIDEMEGYFDKDFLESLAWRSTFQQWRNEIISTSFIPSSTNFMDILELKDLITKHQ